ncbi:MAG: hypothetical protein PHS79_02365 [Patescibacteria group bacterium]|nr:hypothetical protein [Patescibacteria group bacterium]
MRGQERLFFSACQEPSGDSTIQPVRVEPIALKHQSYDVTDLFGVEIPRPGRRVSGIADFGIYATCDAAYLMWTMLTGCKPAGPLDKFVRQDLDAARMRAARRDLLKRPRELRRSIQQSKGEETNGKAPVVTFPSPQELDQLF